MLLEKKQMAEKVTPGYHGEYATCRNISSEDAIKRIENGESYIVRLKSRKSRKQSRIS